jgi:DNA replication protein DnaC
LTATEASSPSPSASRPQLAATRSSSRRRPKLTAALAEARSAGTFSRRLAAVNYPRLSIIDEVGFLPLGAEQAALLFEVVSRRYERARSS